MIGTLLNLLFRCPHRRLTHPVAPITNVGKQHSQAYVVCLDCGKPFEYDMEEMKIGKLIDDFHGVYAVPKNMTSPLATKVKYGVLAVVPVALAIGTVLKAKKARRSKRRKVFRQATGREACPAKSVTAGICRPGKAKAPQSQEEPLPHRPPK